MAGATEDCNSAEPSEVDAHDLERFDARDHIGYNAVAVGA